jgi:hypothetical protein
MSPPPRTSLPPPAEVPPPPEVVPVAGWRRGRRARRYRFERDRRKDNDLRRAEIEVMRIIRREITHRSHGTHR